MLILGPKRVRCSMIPRSAGAFHAQGTTRSTNNLNYNGARRIRSSVRTGASYSSSCKVAKGSPSILPRVQSVPPVMEL